MWLRVVVMGWVMLDLRVVLIARHVELSQARTVKSAIYAWS